MIAGRLTPGQKPASLFLRSLDVPENLIELHLVDLRSLKGIVVGRIADLDLPSLLDEQLEKLVVHAFMNENTRPGAA